MENDHINMRVPPTLKAEIVKAAKRQQETVTSWLLGLASREILRQLTKDQKEKKS